MVFLIQVLHQMHLREKALCMPKPLVPIGIIWHIDNYPAETYLTRSIIFGQIPHQTLNFLVRLRGLRGIAALDSCYTLFVRSVMYMPDCRFSSLPAVNTKVFIPKYEVLVH